MPSKEQLRRERRLANRAGHAIVTAVRQQEVDPYEVRDIGLRGLIKIAEESDDERLQAQCYGVLATLGCAEVKRREELEARRPLEFDDSQFTGTPVPAPPDSDSDAAPDWDADKDEIQ